MSAVREQAKATEEVIPATIEMLISLLRDREVSLINDVETAKHQKEKELQLQKDDLEFLLSGVRHAVLFSEAMIKEGSETEIVSGHQQVVARMTTLTKEREKAPMEPWTVADIEFVGGEEGADLLSSVIKELGTVMTKDVSAEQFAIEIPRATNYFVNQAYSFKVILKAQTRNKVSAELMSKSVKALAVEVTGSSEVKVRPAFIYYYFASA